MNGPFRSAAGSKRLGLTPASFAWHYQRQTHTPFTCTRTQAGAPTTAAPTAAPPTTARRVVRRATPATLTGVNGRPTRACALSIESARPSLDQSIEPATPNATTAAANNNRFRLICFIAISLSFARTDNFQGTLPIIDMHQRCMNFD
jgi:hypothetical protein